MTLTDDVNLPENSGLGPVSMTGAEVVVKTLEAFGIEVVFGMCGHTNLAMLAAIERSSIRFVGVRHEQVAAHAADGYYRASRRPAAVLTTIGPGLTNALTGIGDAALDGAAMVVIAGDVPTYFSGRNGFQELSLHGDSQQTDVVRPLVKRAWKVSSRRSMADVTMQACQHAVGARPGPVLIDVPMDLFSERHPELVPTFEGRLPVDPKFLAPQHVVVAAAEAIVGANNPVIYAGGGAAASNCQASLTRLAEYLGLPVVTSLSGQGTISQDHELNGGYTATVGSPVAHQLVNEADVILALGTQFGEMETSSFDPEISFRVPPTRIIQVDTDPTQIGRVYPVDIGVVADVDSFLAQLMQQIEQTEVRRNWRDSPRHVELRSRLADWAGELSANANSPESPIAVERLLADLRRALPRDGIFLTDVGIRHQVAQQFNVYRSEDLYVGSGWGTMGGAVGAAIGAKVARPDSPVIAEVGDGAFSSVLSAVITAVEFDIPVIWVVMNNFGYSSISVYQNKHKLGEVGTSFRTSDGEGYNPDFAALARACGAEGLVITDPEDLLPALEKAIESNSPWVLDVHTEPAPRTRASGYWDVNDILSRAAL